MMKNQIENATYGRLICDRASIGDVCKALIWTCSLQQLTATDMVVSQNKGTPYRPQNTTTLIIGTPKKISLFRGNPNIDISLGHSHLSPFLLPLTWCGVVMALGFKVCSSYGFRCRLWGSEPSGTCQANCRHAYTLMYLMVLGRIQVEVFWHLGFSVQALFSAGVWNPKPFHLSRCHSLHCRTTSLSRITRSKMAWATCSLGGPGFRAEGPRV